MKVWAFWLVLTTFGGLTVYFTKRWWENRRPLAVNAKKLLKRIKSDPTHDAKGITIHRDMGMMNYWTFRVLESDPVELGMFYEIQGEYLEVCNAVDELVEAKKLRRELDSHSHSGLEIYRLV